jgi:hypothetical protein
MVSFLAIHVMQYLDINIIKQCVFVYVGHENITMGCFDLIWVSLHLVGASHDYFLKIHMNEHTLLNNVMDSTRKQVLLSHSFMVVHNIPNNFFYCDFSGSSLPLIFCIHVRSGPIYWGGYNLPCKKNYKVMVFYM